MLEQSGKSVTKHATDTLMKAAGYMYVLNRIAHQGSEKLRHALKGPVLDDDTARSLLFEVDVATNFFTRGYDVEFMDMEAKANYDLLISDGKISLEIECKRKSADAGRKIARSDFYLLADILFSRLLETRKRFLVNLTSDSRMGSDQSAFQKLGDEIGKQVDNHAGCGQIGHIRFEIKYLPSNIRINSDEEAAKILAPYWSGSAHFGILSGKNTTVIIKGESTQQDKVLKAIYEELKHGATQFSKTRPALLACFIEDIDDTAWAELAQKSGLQIMTHRLFSSSDRAHLWRVVYSSDRTPVKRYENNIEFHATTLSWENPSCKFSMPKSFLAGTHESD
jgi:hypothetical protein